MKTMIENLINGNLTDAKKQAKRFSATAIWQTLCSEYGWSATRAKAAAYYLKTGKGFQAYCDAN